MSPTLKTTRQADEKLMARVKRGDTTAFAQLYDRHSARAFRVARAVCGEISHAEDAVQEGFLAIWRSRASFRPHTGAFQESVPGERDSPPGRSESETLDHERG